MTPWKKAQGARVICHAGRTLSKWSGTIHGLLTEQCQHMGTDSKVDKYLGPYVAGSHRHRHTGFIRRLLLGKA